MTIEATKLSRNATIIGISANVILVAIKLTVGISIDSLSLIADGLDSCLDIITALFAYIGYKYASKPPDEDHHYGHHKMDSIFSLMITLILFISSITIFAQAMDRLVTNSIFQFDMLGLVSALLSIFVKFSISIYIIQIGRKIGSNVLVANGKNYRTDAIASFFVSFAMIGAYFGYGWLDTITAIIICIFIIHTGIEIARVSIFSLLDIAPEKALQEKIGTKIEQFQDIKEYHYLRLRYIGNSLAGDCHILVEPEMKVIDAHEIAENMEKIMMEEFNLIDFVVHIEPFIPEERRKKKEFRKCNKKELRTIGK